MVSYDSNKDLRRDIRSILKPFGLEASSRARFWRLEVLQLEGRCHARAAWR